MISPNVTYQFYPNDAVDWYRFRLNAGGDLTVWLTEFIPLAGQIAVYRGSNCDNLLFLGSDGNFSTFKIVNLGLQPAGDYYVFLSNDGTFDNDNPYTLRVLFGSSD